MTDFFRSKQKTPPPTNIMLTMTIYISEKWIDFTKFPVYDWLSTLCFYSHVLFFKNLTSIIWWYWWNYWKCMLLRKIRGSGTKGQMLSHSTFLYLWALVQYTLLRIYIWSSRGKQKTRSNKKNFAEKRNIQHCDENQIPFEWCREKERKDSWIIVFELRCKNSFQWNLFTSLQFFKK